MDGMNDIDEELDCYILENALSDQKKIVKQYNLGTYIDLDGQELEGDQIIIEDFSSQIIEDDSLFPNKGNYVLYNENNITTVSEDNSDLKLVTDSLEQNEIAQRTIDLCKQSLINQLNNLQKNNEEYEKLIIKSRNNYYNERGNISRMEKKAKDNESAWVKVSNAVFSWHNHGRALPLKTIWKPEEQLKLSFAIKNDLIDGKIARGDKELKKKCEFFERKLRDLRDKPKLKTEDEELRGKYIRALKILKKEYLKKSVSELVLENPNHSIDWLKISIQEFNYYRTADECETIWERFLHPKYNDNEWTEDENELLIAIAAKYKNQNWEMIAEELNNNRSVHECFTHFQIDLKKRFVPPWSPEEDQLLKAIIPLYTYSCGGYIQWTAVASFFPERTRHQVYIHYMNSKKRFAKWTMAEDITLIAASRFVGPFEVNLSQYLKHRSAKSIGQRWRNNLINVLKKRNTYFSKEDDQDLWKYGNRYNFNLDKIQPHFHEYSRTTLNKRLMILKKFSNLNSGKIKFDNIPRRKPKDKTFLPVCLAYARILIRSGIKPQFVFKKIGYYIVKHSSIRNWDCIKKFKASKMKTDLAKATNGIKQILQCQYYPNNAGGREKKFLDTTNEIYQTTRLTKFYMKSLQAQLTIPKDISAPTLALSSERLEKAVFSQITTPFEITKFPELITTPPTFPSIVGFRTILLNRTTLESNIRVDKNNTKSPSTSVSEKAKKAKETLLNRMRLLFLGPAFMSAISPSNIVNAEDTEEDHMTTIERSKIIRTYSKKKTTNPAQGAASNLQQHLVNVNIQRNHLSGAIVEQNNVPNPPITRNVIYISPNDVQDKITQLINEKKIDASKIIVINQLKNNGNNNIKTYSRKRIVDVNKQAEKPSGSLNTQTSSMPKNTSDTENACQLFEDPLRITPPEEKQPGERVKHGHNKKRMPPKHLIEKHRENRKRKLEEAGIEEIPKPKRIYVKTGIYSKKNDENKTENQERRTSGRLSKKES